MARSAATIKKINALNASISKIDQEMHSGNKTVAQKASMKARRQKLIDQRRKL